MDIYAQIKATKLASKALELLDHNQRNEVLRSLTKALRNTVPEIIQENAKDLSVIDPTSPMYDRLLLTPARIESMAADIETQINLPSPIGKRLEQRIMSNDLLIEKISVPLGVVAVIFESRPNVTVDVFTLCFKAGNACILKGGKEAFNSNQYFVKLIQKCLTENNIESTAVCLLSPDREDTKILLNAIGLIDVCIPRGGNELINFVRNNAKIPVIETGAGIVHIYFDSKGDVTKGKAIICNAKTRRVSVCNALDCLIIHASRLSELSKLVETLQQDTVEIFADRASFDALQNFYPQDLLKLASDSDYGREFLSYKMAIKTVNSVQEAIDHIALHTSNHSEAIITEDPSVAEFFVQRVDAAVVYVNASTAFTDGGQFGMGAEVGISTQKLHARGPMGLEALTSYKWVVHGNGQIRP